MLINIDWVSSHTLVLYNHIIEKFRKPGEHEDTKIHTSRTPHLDWVMTVWVWKRKKNKMNEYWFNIDWVSSHTLVLYNHIIQSLCKPGEYKEAKIHTSRTPTYRLSDDSLGMKVENK